MGKVANAGRGLEEVTGQSCAAGTEKDQPGTSTEPKLELDGRSLLWPRGFGHPFATRPGGGRESHIESSVSTQRSQRKPKMRIKRTATEALTVPPRTATTDRQIRSHVRLENA